MTHGTAKNKQQHYYINNSGATSYSSSSTSSSNSSAVANSSTANNNENEPGGKSREFLLIDIKFVLFFLKDFLIGYGAFGVIWAVTDPRTSRRVALKKMPNVFQSVVAARRAFREIKMLCTFRHDNVKQKKKKNLIFSNLFCFIIDSSSC